MWFALYCMSVQPVSISFKYKKTAWPADLSIVKMNLALAEGGTSVGKKTPSLKWTIHDATMSLMFDVLKSPELGIPLPQTGSTCLWQLMIWRKRDQCNKHVALNYKLKTTENSEDSISEIFLSNCRLSILNFESQEVVYYKVLVDDAKLLKRTETLSCDADVTEYLFNDTLCIKVEASLSFLENTGIPPYSICEDIYSLYKNEALTDTIIKCEDREFKVHRVILASQSPVFRAMFEVDIKEKQSGVIEVSGTTPAVMSDLVAYLYTGTAPNLKTLAGEMMDVAEQYRLLPLFEMCKYEAKSKETSVIKTLIFADLHNRSCLKKACLEFIRLNPAKVFQTSEWTDFKDHKDQYASLYMEALESLNSSVTDRA